MIEDSMGNRNTKIHAGPEYHPRGANVLTLPLYDLFHLLCDILVPMMRVIVVLPLTSSITTVPNCPRGFLLDSRPASLRGAHFRLLHSFECKSGIWARMHETSAGSRVGPRGVCGDGGD